MGSLPVGIGIYGAVGDEADIVGALACGVGPARRSGEIDEWKSSGVIPAKLRQLGDLENFYVRIH